MPLCIYKGLWARLKLHEQLWPNSSDSAMQSTWKGWSPSNWHTEQRWAGSLYCFLHEHIHLWQKNKTNKKCCAAMQFCDDFKGKVLLLLFNFFLMVSFYWAIRASPLRRSLKVLSFAHCCVKAVLLLCFLIVKKSGCNNSVSRVLSEICSSIIRRQKVNSRLCLQGGDGHLWDVQACMCLVGSCPCKKTSVEGSFRRQKGKACCAEQCSVLLAVPGIGSCLPEKQGVRASLLWTKESYAMSFSSDVFPTCSKWRTH